MSHVKQAMAFLASRGYNKKIAKGMLDSLKQAGISDSALNGALMSLGGTGSIRFALSLPVLQYHKQQQQADSEDGLVSLGLAVQKELAMKEGKKEIRFEVSVPHTRDHFTCVGYEDQTIKDFVLDGTGEGADRLADYVECACSGVMACSTCHVIVHRDWFDRVGHPDDAELDMLELAHGETDTSRLGCQIKLSESLNGLKITIPDGVNNLMDDIPFPD